MEKKTVLLPPNIVSEDYFIEGNITVRILVSNQMEGLLSRERARASVRCQAGRQDYADISKEPANHSIKDVVCFFLEIC